MFWLRFQKEIAGLLILVLVGIVAWTGYKLYTDKIESAAAAALANARNPEAYQTVIARYPKTPAGASAFLLLAEAQRQQKKFADANTTLQLERACGDETRCGCTDETATGESHAILRAGTEGEIMIAQSIATA